MLLEDRILKKWLLPFILSVLIAVDSMAQCIPVYKDSSMSVERRVTDLLGRMTLREKNSTIKSFAWLSIIQWSRGGLPKIKRCSW